MKWSPHGPKCLRTAVRCPRRLVLSLSCRLWCQERKGRPPPGSCPLESLAGQRPREPSTRDGGWKGGSAHPRTAPPRLCRPLQGSPSPRVREGHGVFTGAEMGGERRGDRGRRRGEGTGQSSIGGTRARSSLLAVTGGKAPETVGTNVGLVTVPEARDEAADKTRPVGGCGGHRVLPGPAQVRLCSGHTHLGFGFNDFS